MKKKSIIGLFLSLLGLGVTTTSCEDMLTPDIDQYAEGFTGRDTVNFYFGILSNLQDVIENNVLLGDIRSDLIDTTSYVSDTVSTLANFDKVDDGDNGLLDRAAYYKVINQCNYYLAAVDTMAQKNNNYYMRREAAQVQMVRAWTYMQLVQNYGSVPFITSPVSNANTGWETNPEGGWATPDNLLDLLLKNGLEQAYLYEKTYGMPSYGSVNNGNTTISTSLFVFPADVVMGDLYLLRGSSTADFEKAASYYYTYIDEQISLNSRSVNSSYKPTVSVSGVKPNQTYISQAGGTWGAFLDRGSEPSSIGELVTVVASASNSSMGTVLTRATQIYGFDPTSTSTSTTTTSTNSSGEEETTYNTSGVVTVVANYQSRQLAASKRFTNLSSSQTYCVAINNSGEQVTDASEEEIVSVEYWPVGDTRITGSVRSVSTSVGALDFIQKRASNASYGTVNGSLQPCGTSDFSFNYTFPIYRLRQIYLRYAEAVNRAGYPRYAFAILRDGLNSNTIPTVYYDSIKDGKIFPYASPAANGADIDVDELRRGKNVTWLDFSESYWDDNIGIHAIGCGTGYDLDTLYCYDVTVGQRIADEAARVQGLSSTETARLAKAVKAQLKDESESTTTDEDDATTDEGDTEEDEEEAEALPADDPKIPDNIGEQINAVETLIADEMALETAFEGARYYDLLRIARHKNNDAYGFTSSDYGTNWFAWTIARRSVDLSPYEQPTVFNASLYSKLQSIDNWYLKSPEY